MGENVRTHYEVHVHGLTAAQLRMVCERFDLWETSLEDNAGQPFKLAKFLVPYTDLEVTYYTRDLTWSVHLNLK